MRSRLPAIVNIRSGTASDAIKALATSGAFDVHEVEPDAIASTVKQVVAAGATRVLVAGGDGTIATAAAALLESPAELAVLPGGTLNHFARDLGISTVAAEAVKLAGSEGTRPIDVGMVNDHVFLNTSSVGAYVRFVRLRERLERPLGYRIASLLAAIHLFATAHRMAVEVEVDGRTRIFRTAFLFIGVGERELQLPTLGGRIPYGRRGLHVMVVSARSRARYLAIGLAAITRGVRVLSRSPYFDSVIVDRLRIEMRSKSIVTVDGEIVSFSEPLVYELRRDALTVVCPPVGSARAHD